jgi:hypothetical protein
VLPGYPLPDDGAAGINLADSLIAELFRTKFLDGVGDGDQQQSGVAVRQASPVVVLPRHSSWGLRSPLPNGLAVPIEFADRLIAEATPKNYRFMFGFRGEIL